MSELVDKLRAEFQDKEYRHAYADECLDTMIATQIKVLREQRGMTQGQLAAAAGMKQPRITVLEDATYSNWSINTLKRFAKAFDVALSVKFETFSRVIGDFESLSRETLERPNFADDLQFRYRRRPSSHGRLRRRERFYARKRRLQVSNANVETARLLGHDSHSEYSNRAAASEPGSNQLGATRKASARVSNLSDEDSGYLGSAAVGGN
jgi:transcriptional regulator with XRE-family HTH domain